MIYSKIVKMNSPLFCYFTKCLRQCSTAMERHPGKNNFYKRKHVIGASFPFQRFNPLSSWLGVCGWRSGWVFYSQIHRQHEGNATGSGLAFENLEPAFIDTLAPRRTHPVQQAHTCECFLIMALPDT